nr:hypothetical protein [Tanacetum cinerariifolium]
MLTITLSELMSDVQVTQMILMEHLKKSFIDPFITDSIPSSHRFQTPYHYKTPKSKPATKPLNENRNTKLTHQYDIRFAKSEKLKLKSQSLLNPVRGVKNVQNTPKPILFG